MRISTTLLFLLFWASNSIGQTTTQKSEATPGPVDKTESIKHTTENADSLYKVGIAKIKKKDYKSGITVLKQALIIKPDLKDKLKRSGVVIILKSTIPIFLGTTSSFDNCKDIARDGRVTASELSEWLSNNCSQFYD